MVRVTHVCAQITLGFIGKTVIVIIGQAKITDRRRCDDDKCSNTYLCTVNLQSFRIHPDAANAGLTSGTTTRPSACTATTTVGMHPAVVVHHMGFEVDGTA